MHVHDNQARAHGEQNLPGSPYPDGGEGIAMRFDWYQATIPDHPLDVVQAVHSSLAPGGEVQEGRGQNGYRQTFTIRQQDGDRVAVVMCGGNNGAHPNAMASGAVAHPFASLVRELWPAHKVTRVDAAEDMAEEGAYEALEGVCRALAQERGLKGRRILPDDPAEGRTYYIGSPASDVLTRLYDKTAETRRNLPPERHGEVPDHWVRIEARVRPRKEAGYVAASLTPEQVWGCSAWTHELARRLFSSIWREWRCRRAGVRPRARLSVHAPAVRPDPSPDGRRPGFVGLRRSDDWDDLARIARMKLTR